MASATGWATSASETCMVTALRAATELRAGMEPALKPDTRVAPAANIIVMRFGGGFCTHRQAGTACPRCFQAYTMIQQLVSRLRHTPFLSLIHISEPTRPY